MCELDWKICQSSISAEGLCGLVRYELVPVEFNKNLGQSSSLSLDITIKSLQTHFVSI